MKNRKTTEEELKGKIGSAKAKGMLGKLFTTGSPIGSLTPTSRECPSVTLNGDIYMDADERLSTFKKEPYYDELKELYERYKHQNFYNVKKFIDDKYDLQQRDYDTHYYNEIDFMLKLMIRDKFLDEKNSVLDKYRNGDHNDGRCYREIIYLFKKYNEEQMMTEQRVLELRYLNEYRMRGPEYFQEMLIKQHNYNNKCKIFERELDKELKNPLQRKKNDKSELFDGLYYHDDEEFNDRTFDKVSYYDEMKKLYEHYKHSEFDDIKKIVDKKYANLGTSVDQNYYTEINRLCDLFITKKYQEEKKFITKRYSYLNMPLDKHYVDELKFLHEQYTNSQYDNEFWILRLKYQNEGRPTNDRTFEKERQAIYKKYDKKQKEYVKKLQEEVGSRRAKGEGELANKGYSPKLRLSQGKPKDGNYRNESYRLHLMTMYDNCHLEDFHNIVKLVTDKYQAIGRPYDDHFYNEIDMMFKLFKNEKFKHERRNIKEKYGGFGLNRDKCFTEIMFLYQKYNDEKKDAEKKLLDLRYKYSGRPQDKEYFTKIMDINGKYVAERKAYKKHLQEELQSSKSDPCDYCGEEYKGIYFDDDEFNDPNFDLPHYYNEMKIKYEKYRHSEFNDAKNFMDEKYKNEGRSYDDSYYCELNALTYMFLKERFDKEKKFIEDKYTTVDLPRDNKNYYYELKFLGEIFHYLQRTYEHALLDLKYYNDGLPRNEHYYLELSDIYKKYDNKHKKYDKALQDAIANRKYNFTEEPDEDDLRNLDYHSKMMSLFKKETRDHDASIQYNMNIKTLKENSKLDEFQAVKKLLDDKYTSIGRPFDDHYYNELDYILKSLNLETYHNLKCRIRERYSMSGNLGDDTSYRHALFTYHLYRQENLNNDKAIINLKYQRRGLPHDDNYHREINALTARYEKENKNYEKKLKAEMETEFNEREYFADFYEAPDYKNDEEFGHSGFDFYVYYSEAKFAFQKYENSEFDEVKKIVDKRFIDEGRLFDDNYYSELKRLADVCTTERYKEETKNITEKYKKLGQTQVSDYYHRELMDAFNWYNHRLSLTEMWITHLKYQNEGKSRDESYHSLMQIIGEKYEEKRLRYAGKLGIHFTRYKGRDYNYNQDDVNPDGENHSEYYNKLQRMLGKYSNEEFDKIKKGIDEKYKIEARPFDKHYYNELERVSYGKCNDKYNDEVEKIHLRYQREVRPRDKYYYNELMSAFEKNSEEKFNLGKVILDLKYKNQGRPYDEKYRNSVKKLYEKLIADNGQQQNKLDAELNGRTANNDFHSAQYKGPVDFVDDDITEEDKKNEQYYNKLKELREKCNKKQFDTVKKIVDESNEVGKNGNDEDYYSELRRIGADKINEQYKKEKKAIKDKYKGQKGLPRDEDYYYQLMRLFEKYNDEHLNHEKLVLELRHQNESLPQDERFHAILKSFYEKCLYDKQAYQEKFLDKIRKNKAPSGKYDDGDNDDAQDFSTHRSSPQSLTDGEYKKKLNKLMKPYDPTEFHNLKQTLDGEYQSSGKSIDADYFKELKTRATKNVKERHEQAKNTIIRIYKQIPGGRRCDEFYKELIECFNKYNDEKFNNEKYILELKYERERIPRREEYHKQVRSIFENTQSEKDKYELKMLEELIKKKNKARLKQQEEDDDDDDDDEIEVGGGIEVTYEDEEEEEREEKDSEEQHLKKQQYDEEVKALNQTFEVEEKRHQESYANELKGLFDKYNKNIKSLLEKHDKGNTNRNYMKEKRELDQKYQKGTKGAALGDDYYGEFKALFDKYPTVNYNKEIKALDDKCATEKAAHDSHYTEKNKVLAEKYNTELKNLCEKYDQQFPGYTKSAKGPLGTQGGKPKTKKGAAPNQRKPIR